MQYILLLQDSKHYWSHPDCTSPAQSLWWPTTERQSLRDDHLSMSLRIFSLPLGIGCIVSGHLSGHAPACTWVLIHLLFVFGVRVLPTRPQWQTLGHDISMMECWCHSCFYSYVFVRQPVLILVGQNLLLSHCRVLNNKYALLSSAAWTICQNIINTTCSKWQ